MNISQLFAHWRIVENPFRGEEARHDEVFARLARWNDNGQHTAIHSDFEKILGQLSRPSSAIVFGEKGSGKTAIRLQIARAIDEHNAAHPERKAMLISYDDLNRPLDALRRAVGGNTPADTLGQIRLTDHVDAIISVGTTSLVDALLERAPERSPLGDPSDLARRLRQQPSDLRRDLLVLQALYDASPRAPERTRRLRLVMRLAPSPRRMAWTVAALGGWILPLGVVLAVAVTGGSIATPLWAALLAGSLALWGAALAKRLVLDRMIARRWARRLGRSLRTMDRTERSLAGSLAALDPRDRDPSILPLGSADEPRYAMLTRLRRVLNALGVAGLVVVVDRVDEPTLINGDPDRMRAVIWPMLNNKFLQQEGLGVKLLLPIELRHMLYKESSAFFQEARLDKQGLIDRLSWTGPMLYDLCDARLNVCREEGAEPISLVDLFAEDVTRQDVVDALDQMHQPRDAFKLLYRCLTEHCSSVTADQQSWRVPRLVLEGVRRQEADRLQQLYRGIRPA